MRVLSHARIPELPNPYFGKVRDCYDLAADASHPNGRRILIASDRISAFDRILAAIPYKGQILTQIARFWFDRTADILPNHVLSYPDPNVVIGQRLTILPVEVVVRGYLAGSTSTSVLTQYKQGQRAMYGHVLPDGMRDNQILARPIITPTSKAFDGDHDAPLTASDILSQGLLTADQWDEVSTAALALFARGQHRTDKHHPDEKQPGQLLRHVDTGREAITQDDIAQHQHQHQRQHQRQHRLGGSEQAPRPPCGKAAGRIRFQGFSRLHARARSRPGSGMECQARGSSGIFNSPEYRIPVY